MTEKIKDLRERVFTICQDLEESGDRCSVRNVLDRVHDYSSTSSIQPFVKAWKEERLKERERASQRLQLSPDLLSALVNEAEQINKARLTLEREKVETYKSLMEEASNEMEKLSKKLVASTQDIKTLQSEKQALVNQVEVMRQTEDSKREALKAQAEKLISENKQELEVARGINTEHMYELTSLRAAVAELKSSSKQLEKQVLSYDQQQQNLIAKNQTLHEDKTELTKEVAVLNARIVELEKASEKIDSLKEGFSQYLSEVT